uniref:Ig-like domain-containing protein n=1 Tax=Gadus morhua TaxID=8049 RepID=A0A8C5CPE6_GADMO
KTFVTSLPSSTRRLCLSARSPSTTLRSPCKEGQSCTLTCQLSVPNGKTEWLKNGKQIDVKGRFTSEVKHKIQKLVIEELKPEDQGRYSCRYQNLESTAELWVEGLYTET